MIEPVALPVCVMCGSKRIRRQAVAVPLGDGRSQTVEAEVCPRCGERYFDRAAMQALEAAAGKPHRSARTRVVR